MDVILHQIGGLIVGSVPTMVFFILLVVAYGFLVRRPLDAVLAKRRELTIGAVEQARGAMSAAEAETAVFEDKLRIARAEIFAARDARIQQWASEREVLLADARAITANRINSAKAEIEASSAASRQQIESLSEDLSTRILRAVLPSGVAATEAIQ